jgi:chemosensory pili system protein ChpA (sensor histidine kinase/response regulator)
MSGPGQEFVELFLQEASEHLQFLREYSGVLLDPYPLPEDIERLYIAAHGLAGTAGTYGYKSFSEVTGKLAHIFQYAMNSTIGPDACSPLVEFIYEAVAVLESDLLMISANGVEAEDDVKAFKQRYPFAFQQPVEEPDEQAVMTRAQSPAERRSPAAPPADAPGAQEPSPNASQSSSQSTAAPLAEEPLAAEATPLAQPAQLPRVPETPAEITTANAAETFAVPASEPGEVLEPAASLEAQNVFEAATEENLFELETQAAQAFAPSLLDLPADGNVAPEVLEFFVPEVEEHLQAVTESLLSLEANPNPEDINKLFRAMHTIKGSAAQVGFHRLSAIAHRAEDLIARLRDGELKPSANIVDLCLESVDILKKQLYRQWSDEQSFQDAALAYCHRIDQLEDVEAEILEQEAEEVAQKALAAEGQMPLEVAAEPVAEIEADVSRNEREEIAALAAGRRQPAGVPQSKSVRIALERLDRMMNAVGELVTNRTRMLGRLKELERLADVLNFSKARMTDKVGEFQEKYEFSRVNLGPLSAPGHSLPRRSPLPDEKPGNLIAYPFRGGYSSYSRSFDSALAEFSELEMDRYDDFGILSRSLTEISADITEVLTQLDGFVRRVDGDIDEFTKLAHRLQDEITQSRMVPIGNLYTRLSRAVRDAAKAAGKRVELALAGAETELDNNIIQQIADPLLHLVRNAVAHGIERADERYNSGKSDSGNIAVRAYHRGNHIFIEVEDDGRGIDYERVRAAAAELELINAEQANLLSPKELLDLMFLPGFSTAPRKTELAGRGVGLDVVRTNLDALNGEIEIETRKGVGTRFTLKVPLTLIISQALFVRVGKHTFAFPLAFVEEIRRVRSGDIEEVGGKRLAKIRDALTEVVHLDAQLGLEAVQPVNGWYRLVVVNVAGKQVGIVVEEVIGKDEIVIKNLGEYLRNVKMFPGATIAPDGSLILLVDLNRLVVGESIERRPLMTAANAARIFLPGATAVAAGEIPDEAIDRIEKEKLVLLVDDSISVRKFVGRMLEKAGYRVRLASDGLEALEFVSQGGVDLVVTDLEMPRTNGYELMLHLRQNPETRDIPVMVVTSRAGSKHRERAMHEGARAFMVKPVQEEQLVAQVGALIGSSGQAVSSKLSAGR